MSSNINLDSLTSAQGFKITGANAGDRSGYSVSAGGDINGDGYSDIVVGAPYANYYYGVAYIIFGKPSNELSNIAFSNLTSSQGISIVGINEGYGGWAVSGDGDVNGDGYSDIIIGAHCQPSYACTGISTVIFGHSSLNNINLASLTPTQGFTITGVNPGDKSGYSVSFAGDMNKDGYTDIIIGAPYANANAGKNYIIFGKAAGFTNIALSDLTPSIGIVITGASNGDLSGWSVASTGDVNKDGYDDVIIGAYGAESNAGISYVIFGNKAMTNINLASMTVTQGYKIVGVGSSDKSGYSVAGTDLDGDGYSDIIIGVPGAYSSGGAISVASGTIINKNLDHHFNNVPTGTAASNFITTDNYYFGSSISKAGDVNGDGFNDYIVGAYGANLNTGISYVIYGSAAGFSNIEILALSPAQGFSISGENANDYSGWSVSGAGDINGDGYSDIVIGANGANSNAGVTYVIFGAASGFVTVSPTRAPTQLPIIASTTSLQNGLVAYFPFNGNANDESGNNHATTVNGATLTTDRFGNSNNAYYFSSSSNIQIANSNLLDIGTNSYSISAWIKLDQNSNNMRIFSHGSYGCTPGYMLRTGGSNLVEEFSCSSGGCALGGSSSSVLTSGTWYFITNTVQREGDAKIYINAVSYGQSSNVNTCSIASGVSGYIGYAPQGEQFYGSIDEVRIYNRALTPEEVQQLYTQESSSSAPSVAPTYSPTPMPTASSTHRPTKAPTVKPTHSPTKTHLMASNIDLGNLISSQGFVINGASAGDKTGNSVSSAGDINGDGYADFLIGAYGAYTNDSPTANKGIAYLVLGSANINSNTNKIPISYGGTCGPCKIGYSVSGAGDINGDGKDDILIGSPGIYGDKGRVYIIYGSTSLSNINVANLGTRGTIINGIASGDQAGYSISAAGDVNGDGYPDVIIGAPYAYSNSGKSYVIYGNNTLSNIDLSDLEITKGFTLLIGGEEYLGYSVSGDDVNADGYSDLIIGLYNAASGTGAISIIFGQNSFTDLNLNSATQPYPQLIIWGVNSGDKTGFSVGNAGDINGDGYNDIIIGAPQWNNGAGISYIVFGASSYANNIGLGNLTNTQGFSITSFNSGDQLGYSVSGAGDVNNDGYDDIIIGAYNATLYGKTAAGIAYLIFGRSNPININLSNFDSSQGFVIYGANANDQLGISVSSAGDINKDGYDDIIIGAPGVNSNTGAAYVIYGNAFSTTPAPTSQPTSHPSSQPTTQPSTKPTSQPSSLPTSSPTTNLQNGLVAYYPFDGNANDATGNEHNTTVYGATLTTDRFDNANSAYHFDGSSKIEIQNSNLLDIGTNDYAVSAWIKLDQTGSLMRIYHHGSVACMSAYPGHLLMIYPSGQIFQENTCIGGGCALTQLGSSLSTNTWYFITSTVQRNGYARIYIDGITNVQISFSSTCDISNGKNGYIGNNPDFSGEGFYGSIDELRIYNRALTPEEVLALYQYDAPTSVPTGQPTAQPISQPTSLPTNKPTSFPTILPDVLDNWCSSSKKALVGDFNGDGKDDLWCNDPITSKNQIMISNGRGFIPISSATDATGTISLGWGSSLCRLLVGDFNGDGKDDLWCNAVDGSNWFMLSTGSGFTSINSNVSGVLSLGAGIWCASPYKALVGDFNGDGKDDLWCNTSGNWFMLSTGNSFISISSNIGGLLSVGGISNWCLPSYILVGDFNGDGRSDLWCNNYEVGGLNYFMLSTGSNFVPISSSIEITGKINIGYGSWCDSQEVARTGKFSNDNKTDLWCHSNSGLNYFLLSTGNSFVSANSIIDGKLDIGSNANWCYESTSKISVGDFNGDGKDDLWCNTNGKNSFAFSNGDSFTTVRMTFSTEKPTTAPTPKPTMMARDLKDINLATLSQAQGFSITGANTGDKSGWSISRAGDVNGDGKADIIIGSPHADADKGVSYVIYGGNNLNNINLATLTTSQGFSITGTNNWDISGSSVKYAGDVNNDGFDDIIIGAVYVNSRTGESYVIYGGTNLTNIYLATLTQSQGISIIGAHTYDYSGVSVSGAGDVNGDHYDDIIIGAGSATSLSHRGISYVIYGRVNLTNINLAILTTSQGFSVTGANGDPDGDSSGQSVSDAGDVNGDGYDDVIIAAPGAASHKGISYVVYGGASLTNINLATLTATQGFLVTGAAVSDELIVSGAGDVNGDGYSDIIIGASGLQTNKGISYVIFGNSSLSNLLLSDLIITQGFSITGAYPYDRSGRSAAKAGDVNGDGYDDIIIGAPYALNGGAGVSYVIYGGKSIYNIALSSFSSSQGFSITGKISGGQSGASVSSAGDFNGDGYDDIMIGTYNSAAQGITYVILDASAASNPSPIPTALPTHSPTPLPTKPTSEISDIDLSLLQPHQGFVINGVNAGDQLGYSVSNAGDVNGDGFDDIIVGTPYADYTNGISYVIFGNTDGLGNINLSNLTLSQGFSIHGDSYSGISVSGAGDVNGDEYDDIIIGSQDSTYKGRQYVIFGKANGFANINNIRNIPITEGFVITGEDYYDHNGDSVAAAGDINNDGFDDVIIGAYAASPYSRTNAGKAYVIFGNYTHSNINLANLGNKGFIIYGATVSDLTGRSVASAGDVNGDGFDDIIIGAPNANSGRGKAYVIFGNYTHNATIDLANLDILQGFIISGSTNNGQPSTGYSVSGAGDINNDGYDDVIIGAYYATPDSKYTAGISYIIYGKQSNSNIDDLRDFGGTKGFAVYGAVSGDFSGYSVSDIGDINGDGYADIIIGAYGASSNQGKSYVIFGKTTDFNNIDPLSGLTSSQGFVVIGVNAGDQSSFSVSGAGDVNGDGYSDYIIGAPGANSNAGAAYVLYGNQYQTKAPTSAPTSIPTSSPSVPTSQPTAALDLGLVAYYPFDGNANDESGNGNNGVVHSAVLVADRFGVPNSAYSFDGSSSYIEINGTAFNFENSLSLSVWIKPASSQVTHAALFDKSHDIGAGLFIQQAENAINKFWFGYVFSGGYSNIGAIYNVQTTSNSWNYLVVTKQDTIINLYLDGILVSVENNTPSSFIISNGNLPLVVGANNGGLSMPASVLKQHYSGLLDDIRIYNRALTSEEVAELYIYNSPTPQPTLEPTYRPTMPIKQYANVDLATLNTNQGIAIYGAMNGDYTGYSVSGIGDFNGDGFDDVIVGAYKSSPALRAYAGTSYVIFGHPNGFENIDLLNLAPSQGFKIFGASNEDSSGYSVAGAGDVNGDGFDDIIVGAPNVNIGSDTVNGACYVIFGKNISLSNIDLAKLDTSQGFKIIGEYPYDQVGSSVSGAGDVNGDGLDDIVVGTHKADPNGKSDAGISYVIFGTASDLTKINLKDLSANQGFKILGAAANDRSGRIVSSAGDVNNDGYTDIIIGAFWADYNGKTDAGITYIIFGKSSNFTDIDLSSLTVTQGFKIFGANSDDNSGVGISAGDFNGDGYSDIIIGAPGYDYNDKTDSGISYIIFGKRGNFIDIDLANLSINQGFKILGVAPNDGTGYAVSNAGDVNGDGYSDIIIGSSGIDINARYDAGGSYIIFGKSSDFIEIDLANLNINQGFKVVGSASMDNSGIAVSSAGDFNNDGYDDIIIGAPTVDYFGRINSGAAYIIFDSSAAASPSLAPTIKPTSPTTTPTIAPSVLTLVPTANPSFTAKPTLPLRQIADVNLGQLNENQAISIYGSIANEQIGYTVSGIGDFNGDGFDDVMISGYKASPPVRSYADKIYVIFGSSTGLSNIDLLNLRSSQGFKILGNIKETISYSVSEAGDVNGDGFDDVLVGAYFASPNGRENAGTVYVIFGNNNTYTDIDLTTLKSSQGFRIFGAYTDDRCGWSVASAGDFNGDGFDDVIIGAYGADPLSRINSGTSYIIFGKIANYNNIDLANLTPTQGIKIIGEDVGQGYEESGYAVASADDFNKDGYSDVIIGAHYASYDSKTYAGITYLIFGQKDGYSIIDLAYLSEAQGFKIFGAAEYNYNGYSVSSAGDVNRDGYSDLIIGAHGVSSNGRNTNGASYIIFGKASDFININLASLTSSQGFKIFGAATNDLSGISVASAGDINGDSYDDIVVNAHLANGYAGIAYVIFGKANGFNDIDLSNLSFNQGFKVIGATAYDFSGFSVSGAGDFNGDGYDDIIIGAIGVDPYGRTNAGAAYIILDSSGTATPTSVPTSMPTSPTSQPTSVPTSQPSSQPSAIPTSSPTTNLDNGLVAYYPFDGNANDATGNGNDGVVHGTTLVPDRFGNLNSAYSFDGSSSYIEVVDGAQFDFTNNMTVSVWVNPSASQNIYAGILSKSHLYGVGWMIEQTSVTNKFVFGYMQANINNWNNVYGTWSSTPYIDLIAQQWNHLIIVKLNNTDTYFLNSNAITSHTALEATIKDSENYSLCIGAANQHSGTTRHFSGILDEIRIYNRALTAEEVTELYTYNAPTNLPTSQPTEISSAQDLELSKLMPTQGFYIDTKSVTSAGDINNDGHYDLLISSSSKSYIVYGKVSSANINLANFNNSIGFSINFVGTSYSKVGDINNDSYDDIIIGNNVAGKSYIIYGNNTQNDVDINNFPSWRGFIVNRGDNVGPVVGNAGDFNNDGYDDILIGGPPPYYGKTYLIYGGKNLPNMDLGSLSSSHGFSIEGTTNGWTVKGIGDINNDRNDDILVSTSDTKYIIFGKNNPSAISLPPSVDVGFALNGINTVSGAGDFNGDGIDDLIIGEISVNSNSGNSYVIYGRNNLINITIPPTLTQGFSIYGESTQDKLGSSVSGLGDINGDSLDDIVIAASGYSEGKGRTYILYGSNNHLSNFNVTNLSVEKGFTITGTENSDGCCSVDRADDINGDGVADIIAKVNNIARTYIIYGSTSGFVTSAPSSQPTSLPTSPTSVPSSQPTSSPIAQLENGLVAYYPFDGNANDATGRGNDGVVHSATLVEDRFGNVNSAYSFDGSTSYIEVVDGSQFNFINNMSVSVWVHPSITQNAYAGILDKSHYSYRDWFIEGVSGEDFAFGYFYGQGQFIYANAVHCTSNTWNHITFTKNDHTIVSYFNGYQIGLRSHYYKIDTTNTNLPLLIGAENSGSTAPATSLNRFFRGIIDDIRIYDRALSSEEVAELYTYNAPTPSPTMISRAYADVDLATLNINQGIKISGIAIGDKAGYSVANAGDFNGDGFDDVIIGASEASPLSKTQAGISYVLFGSANPFANIDLSALTTSQGFKIFGEAAGDESGYSVAGAGDFNNDGYDDIIIGARFADSISQGDVGVVYVIFGNSTNHSNIDLANLSLAQGFKILGVGGYLGWSVSAAGDINNDGYGDVIVGAPQAGITYLIFGRMNISSNIDLLNLTTSQGFKIVGAVNDQSGISVNKAGDVNKDGYSDIIIGAIGVDTNTDSYVDAGYVVFGKANGFADIDLATMNSTQGFRIIGYQADINGGQSLSYAGDVNGDGIDDIIIGFARADHD